MPTFAVSLIVVAANLALLILQLLAGKLLAPVIGSSLETWTSIIGVFLAGIALGNYVGGGIADRSPSPKRLAAFLIGGAAATLVMVALPKAMPALPIPVAAFLECFPAAFVLSMITPLAVRLRTADLERSGRAAGTVFALGTLGSLVGNYLTGFVLVPHFAVSTIAMLTAAVLASLALLAVKLPTPSMTMSVTNATPVRLFRAGAIVFCSSFAAMMLELTASRLLAEVLGVSLYTWTGIIGVMLAGTATGNWLGGRVAKDETRLWLTLVAASLVSAVILGLYFTAVERHVFETLDLMPQIMVWTFLLFFLPMVAFGMVSPQVIKLAVTDAAHVGRVAGRVYAISTLGAIVGTFATGYGFISGIGMYRTILVAALLALLAGFIVSFAITRPMPRFLSLAVFVFIAFGLSMVGPHTSGINRESNYYTIRVMPVEPNRKSLRLDSLTHSVADVTDPTYLFYVHEKAQLAFFQAIRGPTLVIGGGGYTFPRAARAAVPGTTIDVVEIDPAVTAVSVDDLGFVPGGGITSFHLDGRQFVDRIADKNKYALVTLDAVNDLSVPGHLLTKEFNDAVKRTLKPDGVYLVTVIDNPAGGRLWQSTLATLRETFQHVHTLSLGPWDPNLTKVQIVYASDVPLKTEGLDVKDLQVVSRDAEPTSGSVVLTDDYAPVDNFMTAIFKNRRRETRD